MSRRKNRKRRAAKGQFPAKAKPQSAEPGLAAEQIIVQAGKELAPRWSPDRFQARFQALLDATREITAMFVSPDDRDWDDPGKRSFLESVFGNACALWQQNQRADAADTFCDLLKLDRDDHQFARYWLAACLLDLEWHDELRRLLEQREEPTAVWRYAQALLAFRLGGDSDDARQRLREAQPLDPHFLDYLLGDALVHADRPVRFDRDPHESTHSLARLFLPAWRSTPGAAAWARKVLRVPLGGQPARIQFPRDELRSLPRRNVTWQVGLRLLDEAEPGSAEPPVWILGIANVDEQKLLYMTVIEEEPVPAVVWREILSAFRQPLDGTPHRPAKLAVPRADLVQAWRSTLAEIAVTCVFENKPQPIGDLLGGMAELVKLHELPHLPSDVDPSEFPQTGDVWQADFFHAPTFISNEQIGVERPWFAIVLDKRSRFVLSNEMLSGEPTPEALWDHLVRSMAHPAPRDPMRPSVVEVSDSDGYDFLKPQLDRLGVACVLSDELPELHDFCRKLAASYGGPEKCALADGPRVTMGQMESFYYAAARYFEQAPWKHVAGEIPIAIRCRGLDVGTRYAIVLGRTGVTLGLVLTNTWDDVRDLICGVRGSDAMSGFSVIFDEVTILAPVDLYLVERNGWPIPAPEAYPAVLRFVPGRQPQSPSAEDLEYLESCLQAIPDFVRRNVDAKTYEVETNGKRVKLRLSWTAPRG
jgi:hypothetical protein